ncbi:MAG: hypothetical protein KJ592_02370 [Nanoarchaeota archaeon]|nr:hypothetical protein [Nanoarchaeota archaeon]
MTENTSSNEEGYAETIRKAEEIVEAYINKKYGSEETLHQAEEIIESKILQDTIDEFYEVNKEFMKGYAKKARELGTFLSFPLIEELDQADARKESGEINVEDAFKIYCDIRFKTIDVATNLVKDSPGLNPPGEGDQGYDPLEISVIFVHLMSKRFGDNNGLAPVGWVSFLDGLVGTSITLEEEVKSTSEFVKKLTSPDK